MWAQVVAGAVSGLASPFTKIYSDKKALEYQKEREQKLLEQREREQKAQLKLAGYIAVGVGVLVLIYLILKD